MSSSAEGILLTFHSVHDALAAEKTLVEAGTRPDLIPVPVDVSSDCGFCLRVAAAEAEAAKEEAVTRASELGLEGIWRIVYMEREDRERREKHHVREY